MTYREYLSNFAPDREDVGSIVATIASALSLGLVIATIMSFGFGDFSPFIALFSVFGGMFAAISVMFFVGTFVYWAIVERNEEY